jgi:hypothetical protein
LLLAAAAASSFERREIQKATAKLDWRSRTKLQAAVYTGEACSELQPMVQESPRVWFRNSPATEASAAGKGHSDIGAPWSVATSSGKTVLVSEGSAADLSVSSSSSSSSNYRRDSTLATQQISLVSLPMFAHEEEQPRDFPEEIEPSHSHEYSQSYSQHLRRTHELTDFADRYLSITVMHLGLVHSLC